MNALDNPARRAFVVEMVGTEHVSNAVSLSSAMFMAAWRSALRSPAS